MSEDFHVEEPDREISFSISASEAKQAREWLQKASGILPGDGHPMSRPMVINELYGAFAAIEQGRGYGGS